MRPTSARAAFGFGACATSIAASLSAEQEVRERLDRDRRHLSAGHDGLECVRHQAEPVLRIDLAPLIPSEDDGRLDEHHAAHRGIEARVEERHAPEPKLLGGVFAARRGQHHLLAQLLLELFDDRAEQLLLAAEVVVQRTARDARELGDLLASGRRETVLGEQLPRRGEQRGASFADRSAWVRLVTRPSRAANCPCARPTPRS